MGTTTTTARTQVLPVANALAYVATLVINYLAVSLPIGGITTAQIATQYPLYFLPANITFSIWGVIYLALGVFVAQQFRPVVRDALRVRRIGWLFVVSCLANCAWLITFQYRYFALSMVAMLVLLVVLIAIYSQTEVGLPRLRRVPPGALRPRTEYWSVLLPFSLYLGWISVATIANASYVLYDVHWDGFGLSGQAWAAIMLFVAAALTIAVIVTRRDIAFTLVVAWAFLGIAARQQEAAPVVAGVAETLGVLLVLALVLRYLLPHGHVSTFTRT